MGECNTFLSFTFLFLPSITALTVCRLFSLIFIGGAADLETSDFARVAKIFFKLAQTVRTAEHCFHWFSRSDTKHTNRNQSEFIVPKNRFEGLILPLSQVFSLR